MATVNKAASVLAKKRWDKTTKKERADIGRSLSAQRWANATPEERAAHGKRLTESRAQAKAEREAGIK